MSDSEKPKPSPRRDTKQEDLSLSLRWAIAGLVFPAVSYLTVYSIIAGEARFFGVPVELISVSLSEVLYITFTLAAFAYILIWMFKDLLMNGSPFSPAFAELSLPFVFIVLLTLSFAWKDGVNSWFWFGVGACVLYIGLTIWVMGLRAKKSGSIKAAFESLERKEGDPLPVWSPKFWRVAFEGLTQLRPVAVLFIVCVVFYLSAVGSGIGYGMAKRQTTFLVPSEQPDRVVLLTGNGTAILGTVDDDNSLSAEFEVVSLTSLGPLREEKVGILVPVSDE